MKSQRRMTDIAVIVLLIINAVLIVFLCSAIIFGYCLEPKEEKSTIGAHQDLGNIVTGTVELTISSDMLGLMTEDETFDYSLTQEQKDNGFTAIKKNEDGSATYTIKRKEYNEYISELKETTKQSIQNLTKDDTFKSIKEITYNDNLSEIVIVADRETFENGLDSLSVFSCGISSCMYQMFDINSDGKCTVKVKDVNTGEIFHTTVYPDALQE